MKTRSHVNKRVDRRIFKKTASRTNARNIPGHMLQRGGTRL